MPLAVVDFIGRQRAGSLRAGAQLHGLGVGLAPSRKQPGVWVEYVMRKKIVLFFTVVLVGAVVFNVFLYRQVREICEAVGPFSQASGSLRQAAEELGETANELSGISRQLTEMPAPIDQAVDDIESVVGSLNIPRLIGDNITQAVDRVAQANGRMSQATSQLIQATSRVNQASSQINLDLDSANDALGVWWVGWCQG